MLSGLECTCVYLLARANAINLPKAMISDGNKGYLHDGETSAGSHIGE